MLHDDYLGCSAYKGQTAHSEAGFVAFFNADQKRYFFAMLDNEGEVFLISEGYPQEKSRENGIQSVIKNRDLKERYAIIDEAGRIYVSLRAGNRKEIARSCDFKTRAEAEAFISNGFAPKAKKAAAPKPVAAKAEKATAVKAEKAAPAKLAAPKAAMTKSNAVTPEAKPAKATAAEKPAAKATVSVEKGKKIAELPVSDLRPDDYLFCAEYVGHSNLWDANGPTGYTVFNHENGQYYFGVYNPNGSIYLRSEGFPTEALRQDELDAVRRNIENGDKYKTKELYGKYINVLFDEKGREVARSCHFDTFAEAFANTPYGRMKVEANLF